MTDATIHSLTEVECMLLTVINEFMKRGNLPIEVSV